MVRDAKGRFLKNHDAPGPGRPPRAVEEDYLNAVKDTVPLDRFVRILDRHATLAERGNVPSFLALIKLMGLDVQKNEHKHTGEVTVTVVYERRIPDHTA